MITSKTENSNKDTQEHTSVIKNPKKENRFIKKFEIINSFKTLPSIIASNLSIEGIINSTGTIEIEGYIKGNVIGNCISIRETGKVEGEISANQVNIRGKFTGNIKAKNLNIFSKAEVFGEIAYQNLTVEDGASIDGQFKKF